MKIWLLTAAFAASVMGVALPEPAAAAGLHARALSIDGSCGGSKGYTCLPGNCCSQWGWCGTSSGHCGSGCQPAWGTCSGSGTTKTTSTRTTSSSSSRRTTSSSSSRRTTSSSTRTTSTRTTSTRTTSSTSTVPTSTGRVKVGNVPYGSTVYNCVKPGYVALTFDDGPYWYTSDLLDILKANNVVATFFLNGQNWGSDQITSSTKRALVKRMIDEGHQVGSHTWDHPDLSTLSASQVTTQMTQLETAFMSILGFTPTYMRPPYFSCGSTCLGVMNSLAYHVINCDLDTQDWQYTSDSTVYNAVNIFNSGISGSSPATKSWLTLAHDVHATTVYTLTQAVINSFKAKGFKSATVGTCMGDPQANWYRVL